MAAAKIIIYKELKRIFTDKRLVFTAFIMPGMLIAIIYSLMGSTLNNMLHRTQQEIPYVYFINTPQSFENVLQTHKEEFDLQYGDIKPDNSEMNDRLLSENVKLYVIFDPQFDVSLNNYQLNGKLPTIELYYNPVNEVSSRALYTMQNILEEYKYTVIGQRLGNQEFVNVYDSQVFEIKNEQKEAGKGISMLLPFMISIFLFAGAMQTGIDSVAGEKERGTMSLLLLTPVNRSAIATGKIISLGIIALISAFSSFIGIIISLPNASYMYGGLVDLENLRYGAGDIFQLALLLIFLTGIYVSLICLLSVMAKNIKEASALVTPVYIIVMIAGMLTMFTGNGEPALYRYAIPVYGMIMAIKSLLIFELTSTAMLVACLSSLAIITVLVFVIGKCFTSERIMMNV